MIGKDLAELTQEAARHIWHLEYANWCNANTLLSWEEWWDDSTSEKLYLELITAE